MLFSYVLYPSVAEEYHSRFGIIPKAEIEVGIFGHRHYTSKVSDFQIQRLLSKKSARPLYYFVSEAHQPEKLSQLIQGYLEGWIGRRISVEVVVFQEFSTFYPVLDGEYLYSNEDELVFTRDLNDLADRCYLSNTKLSLRQLRLRPNFSGVETHPLDAFGDVNIVTYEDIMEAYVSGREMMTRKIALERSVDYDKERGIVSFASHTQESKILLELAEVWNLHKKVTPKEVTVFGTIEDEKTIIGKLDTRGLVVYLETISEKGFDWKSEISQRVGLPFAQWVRESILRILLGMSPLLRVFVDQHLHDVNSIFLKMIENNSSLKGLEADAKFVKTGGEEGYYIIPVLSPEDVERANFYLSAKEIFVSQPDSFPPSSSTATTTPGSMKTWILNTQSNKSYKVTDDAGLSEEDMTKKWNSRLYNSPWGDNALTVKNFQSSAFLKPRLMI